MNWKEMVSRFDAFPHKVSLTLDGREQHKTLFGSIITGVIYALVLVYFAILVTQPLEVNKKTAIQNEVIIINDSDIEDPLYAGSFEMNEVEFIGRYKYEKQTNYKDRKQNLKPYIAANDGFRIAARLDNTPSNRSGVFIEFVWSRSSENGTSFDYLPGIEGTLDLFPPELHDELQFHGYPELFICPNITSVSIAGKVDQDLFELFYVSVFIGDDSNDCQDSEYIKQEYFPNTLSFMMTENYFDPLDTKSPIKTRLITDKSFSVNSEMFELWIYEIKRNHLKNINNSENTFFNYMKNLHITFDESYTIKLQVALVLSSESDYYNQYIDYQPLIETNNRDLDASGSKSLLSSEYSIFYVGAQLGGLYTFLSLTLGTLVSYVNQKSFIQRIVNEFHFNLKLKSSQINDEQVKRKAGNSRVTPLNDQNKNHMINQNRSLFLLESHSLIKEADQGKDSSSFYKSSASLYLCISLSFMINL